MKAWKWPLELNLLSIVGVKFERVLSASFLWRPWWNTTSRGMMLYESLSQWQFFALPPFRIYYPRKEFDFAIKSTSLQDEKLPRIMRWPNDIFREYDWFKKKGNSSFSFFGCKSDRLWWKTSAPPAHLLFLWRVAVRTAITTSSH